MDHQLDLFSVAQGPDFRPLQVLVFKHGCRGRQSVTSLTRSASSWSNRWFNKSKQCGIASQPSCNMYAFGTSFEDRVTTVAKVSDDPQALSIFEARMGLFDKIQSQFRLFLVGKTLGLNPGLRWPPEPGSLWHTKHSVVDSGKTNHQTDDDKTHAIAPLFRQFRGRAIMLPTGTADRLIAVLIQCVVNDPRISPPAAFSVSTKTLKRQ